MCVSDSVYDGQPYVFVSYASADRERVLPLVAALTRAGISVWRDQESIAGGTSYGPAIASAIRGSAAVVILCSNASLTSRNVRQEMAIAWKHERPYLPLLLDPISTLPEEVEYWLEGAQWIEVLDHPASEWLPRVQRTLERFNVEHANLTVFEHDTATSDALASVKHRDHRPLRRTRPRIKPVLVGREREQAQLEPWLTDALDGHGRLVLISGEAGIGKTALTNWLLWLADERGALTRVGGCYDLTTTPPYGPWAAITRTWPDEPGLPSLPDALRDGASLGTVQSQAALFELVAGFLAEASTTRPLVLLLEDLHWADQASLDLLRYLSRAVSELPLLLVATYRDDELTRRHPLFVLLPVLAREPHAQRLSLARLHPGDIGELVTSRYGLAANDVVRLVGYLQRLTEGNPFFTGEVLRTLEDVGAVTQTSAGWHVSALDRVQVPELVRQVIEGRLERLDSDTRRLLEVAAVIGHEVDIDLWIAVSEADDTVVINVLERAIEARLLEELPEQSRLRFIHALVRETIYDGLVSLRRRTWHRRVADELARRPTSDPDAVAVHYQRATDPRATEWLIRAGERAQLAYAWSTAVERYEAALALLNTAGSDQNERGWLQYRIARLQRFSNPLESIDYLDEALRIAADSQDRALMAAARYSRGLCQFFANNRGDAIADMAAGADLLEGLPLDEQERLDLGPDHHGAPTITNPRGFLVFVLAVVGRLDDAKCMGEAMQEGLPRPTPLGELGWSHYGDRDGGLGTAYAQLGHVDKAEAAYGRSRTIYHNNGHYATQASIIVDQLTLVTLPYKTDDRGERERLLAELMDANTRSDDALRNLPQPNSVPILMLEGHWDTATETAQVVLEMAGRVGVALLEREICHEVLGRIARSRGAPAEGWDHLRLVLPDEIMTEPGNQRLSLALAMQRLAVSLSLDAGDASLARDWLAAHERWLGWSGSVLGQSEHHDLLARYHRLAGDSDTALAAAHMALARASEPRQPLALIAAHRTLGELLTERQTYGEAAEHLRKSLALVDACAAPFERALTLVAQAELRAATNDVDDVMLLLAEARTICTTLKAQPTLERAATLEARLA